MSAALNLSMASAKPESFVFGTVERIRQSPGKIDFSALDHERGF
jgi:hypothetical protein